MHEQLRLLPRFLTAHLALSLSSLLVGVLLSVPLGVLASRRAWLGRLLLGGAAVIQTVPSLALLALMVPLLGALRMHSIGFLPAFLALVLYTVLPVLRNTVTGLTLLAPELLEAARGVGMSGWQQLARVELPLAAPVIVAGIRTASVWTVGAATLATPVGADSLGNFIFSGLQTRSSAAVLVGCAGAALLALALDGLGKLLLTGIERRRRGVTLAALGAFAGLCAYAGASLLPQAQRRPVVIGAKTFTEQYILSQIAAERIISATGMPAEVKASLGSSVVFDALVNNSVDLYVDYSGTIWANVMKRARIPLERRSMLAEIASYLRAQYQITLVAPLGFENSYALAMRRDRALQLGLQRIGDLARLSRSLSVGGDYEFFARPEWSNLCQTYALQFAEQRSMDPSLMYRAVADGAVDLIGAFSSDGRIAAYDLVTLEDDRGAIPPYDAIVLAGSRLTAQHPEVIESLRGLDNSIDLEAMRRMNLAVDIDHRLPGDVAREFVRHTPPLAGGATR